MLAAPKVSVFLSDVNKVYYFFLDLPMKKSVAIYYFTFNVYILERTHLNANNIFSLMYSFTLLSRIKIHGFVFNYSFFEFFIYYNTDTENRLLYYLKM